MDQAVLGERLPPMRPANHYDLAYLLGRANLPALPEAVTRLNEAMANDDPIEVIETIILSDPVITARVLHLANSAWYHHGQDAVDSVREAVNTIGFFDIHRLIIVTSVIKIFAGVDSTLVNMQSFWKQSIRLASAARVLAEKCEHHKQPMRIFTSGILAYIGKLVLYIGIPSVAQKVLLICKDEAIPQYQAEQDMVGHDHAEVGAALLQKWLIPDSISTPIKFLYEPHNAPEAHAIDAAILNIAHTMQYTYWHDISLTDPPDEPNQKSLDLLGLDSSLLPQLSREADTIYLQTMDLLNVR
ncbi:MAG: HDOD domain-containing protein [Gammaproteobacteria bacterium]|nr:HDOD domain-containing protein [Gammaproteobacteria bacterium]